MKRSLASSILLLALPGLAHAAPLTYHWKAGQEWHFHELEVTDSKMKNLLQQTEDVQHQERRTGRRWKVVKVDPSGVADVQIEQEYFAMTVIQGGHAQKVDTRSADDGDPMAQFAKAMNGKPYTMRVDAHGTIVEVLGLEDVMDLVRGEMEKRKDVFSAEVRPTFDAMLQGMVGEDGGKANLQARLLSFPPEATGPGSHWTRTLENKAEAAIVTEKLEYRIEGDPAKGPFKVTGTGTESMKSTLENVDVETVKGSYELEWKIDPATMVALEEKLVRHTGTKSFLKSDGKRIPALEYSSESVIQVSSTTPPPDPPRAAVAAPANAPPPDSGVTAIAFAPDGKAAVIGGGAGLLVQPFVRGAEPARIPARDVAAAALGEGGATAFVATTAGHVGIWDVKTGKETRGFDVGAGAWRIAFSPDGARLAVAKPSGSPRKGQSSFDPIGEVELWNVASGSKIRSLFQVKVPISSLSLSSGGKRIIASGNGFSGGGPTNELHVVDEGGADLLEGKTSRLGLPNPIALISPDGKTAIFMAGLKPGKGPSLELWDLDKKTLAHDVSGFEATDTFRLLTCSADGTRLAAIVGDKHFVIWDFARKGGGDNELKGGKVAAGALTPDGSAFLWCDDSGDINVLDLPK